METTRSQVYTPNQIADWFLARVDREAGDSITHLKLQKLVYYAQAWSMVLLGSPLFEEDFQAWAHGPVLRSLFDRFNGSGWDSLDRPDKTPKVDVETGALLEEVFRVYGQYEAKVLERLTHSEAPWIEARGGCSPEERCTTAIPKETMWAFYQAKYQAATASGQ